MPSPPMSGSRSSSSPKLPWPSGGTDVGLGMGDFRRTSSGHMLPVASSVLAPGRNHMTERYILSLVGSSLNDGVRLNLAEAVFGLGAFFTRPRRLKRSCSSMYMPGRIWHGYKARCYFSRFGACFSIASPVPARREQRNGHRPHPVAACCCVQAPRTRGRYAGSARVHCNCSPRGDGGDARGGYQTPGTAFSFNAYACVVSRAYTLDPPCKWQSYFLGDYPIKDFLLAYRSWRSSSNPSAVHGSNPLACPSLCGIVPLATASTLVCFRVKKVC
jgi:hypothetical protein